MDNLYRKNIKNNTVIEKVNTQVARKVYYCAGSGAIHRSFESDWTVVGPTHGSIPRFSNSKTGIKGFAGFKFDPDSKVGPRWSFGVEGGIARGDLKDTEASLNANGGPDGAAGRITIQDEKSLVVNASRSNGTVTLTGFAGYSFLDVIARTWTDTIANLEPDAGDKQAVLNNPLLTKHLNLKGHTFGGALTCDVSDRFSLRLKGDKTQYDKESFRFAHPNFIYTINPETKNLAVELIFRF